MNNYTMTITKTIFENIKTVDMNCFVQSLTDPHATGLCGDELIDVGIIGYGLASQLLGKVK